MDGFMAVNENMRLQDGQRKEVLLVFSTLKCCFVRLRRMQGVVNIEGALHSSHERKKG